MLLLTVIRDVIVGVVVMGMMMMMMTDGMMLCGSSGVGFFVAVGGFGIDVTVAISSSGGGEGGCRSEDCSSNRVVGSFDSCGGGSVLRDFLRSHISRLPLRSDCHR